MTVVTLTGHLGSMGAVDRLLAKRLGYRLAGRELVLEAADALGWSADKVQDFDERTGGLGRRLMELIDHWAAGQANTGAMISAWGTPYADAVDSIRTEDEQYIDALREAMVALASEDDIVLVGRRGQAILGAWPHTVHVRLVCPIDVRARRIAVRDGIADEEARSRVEHSDAQREAWHHKYFGIDYRSPYHYSLVVNTGRMSSEFAAELIAYLVAVAA